MQGEPTQPASDAAGAAPGPGIPFWLYALIVGAAACIVGVANLFVPAFLSMFVELGVELPLPTQAVLRFHWYALGAVLLALPLYPILERRGRAIALFATGAGSLAYVAFLAVALILPIMRLTAAMEAKGQPAPPTAPPASSGPRDAGQDGNGEPAPDESSPR